MKFTIPAAGWPTALANVIEAAKNGDVVEVHSDAMQELAERMRQRRYPDKELVFEVTPLPNPFPESAEQKG